MASRLCYNPSEQFGKRGFRIIVSFNSIRFIALATSFVIFAVVAGVNAQQSSKAANAALTAEQVAEGCVLIYGFPGGRAVLDQIRKTQSERGKMLVTQPDGRIENVNYQKYAIRGANLAADRVRIDQEYPTARFALVYDGTKTFGIFNNRAFPPNADAVRNMENSIFRGLDGLLRYKENESTLELAEREKIMGVDYNVIDVTDTAGRKTRYYVSVKSFRILMLTYSEGGVDYRKRFYNYNFAQGTLVPYKTILWAGDKVMEEVDLGTVTYGQKVDENLFKAD